MTWLRRIGVEGRRPIYNDLVAGGSLSRIAAEADLVNDSTGGRFVMKGDSLPSPLKTAIPLCFCLLSLLPLSPHASVALCHNSTIPLSPCHFSTISLLIFEWLNDFDLVRYESMIRALPLAYNR